MTKTKNSAITDLEFGPEHMVGYYKQVILGIVLP